MLCGSISSYNSRLSENPSIHIKADDDTKDNVHRGLFGLFGFCVYIRSPAWITASRCVKKKGFNKRGIITAGGWSDVPSYNPYNGIKKRDGSSVQTRLCWRQTRRHESEIALTHLPRMDIGKILWDHILDHFNSPLTYMCVWLLIALKALCVWINVTWKLRWQKNIWTTFFYRTPVFLSVAYFCTPCLIFYLSIFWGDGGGDRSGMILLNSPLPPSQSAEEEYV